MTLLNETVTVISALGETSEATATYDTQTRHLSLSGTGAAALFANDSGILASMLDSLGCQGSFLGKISDGEYALIGLNISPSQPGRSGLIGVGDWAGQDLPSDFDIPEIDLTPDIVLPGLTSDAEPVSVPIEVVLSTGSADGCIACGASSVGVQLNDPSLTSEQTELMDDLVDTGDLTLYLGPFTAHVTADEEAGWFRLRDNGGTWGGGCWGEAPGFVPGSYYEPPAPPVPPGPEPPAQASVPLLAPCPYGVTHFGARPLVNHDELDEALRAKQDTLTAGENITIIDNVISATGGGSPLSEVFLDDLELIRPGDTVKMYYVSTYGEHEVAKSVAAGTVLSWEPEPDNQQFGPETVANFTGTQGYLADDCIALVARCFPDQWESLRYRYIDRSHQSNGWIFFGVDLENVRNTYPEAYESIMANIPPGVPLYEIQEPANDPMTYGFCAFSVLTDSPSDYEGDHGHGDDSEAHASH